MAPVDGWWGSPTATIDWCEENYKVTPLIAEFWNTLSNIFFIIPSILMFYIAVIERHEDRYIWCHISVFIVGFGSWCFHMTLLYSMQLLDELPMIYGSAFVLYSHMEVTSLPGNKNRPLQIALVIYCAIVTAVYLFSKFVIFFQAAYGLMVTMMVLASFRVLLYHDHNTPLYIASFCTYMGGFSLWLIDNHYCGLLREYRSAIPVIFKPLLELHAWWHILAGTGTYLSVMFSAHTRYLHLNMKPVIRMWLGVWPYLSVSIPPERSKES